MMYNSVILTNIYCHIMTHSAFFGHVRPMTLADVADVAYIEQRVQSHPWSVRQFTDAVSTYQCTVLQVQQKVVGFCILQTVLDEANLLLIAIHPDEQGKGLGAELLAQSLQRLEPTPVQVFLEVRQSNLSAIRLYEKLGFHQIDLRKNYYPCLDGRREHAVIMVKSNVDSFQALFSR